MALTDAGVTITRTRPTGRAARNLVVVSRDLYVTGDPPEWPDGVRPEKTLCATLRGRTVWARTSIGSRAKDHLESGRCILVPEEFVAQRGGRSRIGRSLQIRRSRFRSPAVSRLRRRKVALAIGLLGSATAALLSLTAAARSRDELAEYEARSTRLSAVEQELARAGSGRTEPTASSDAQHTATGVPPGRITAGVAAVLRGSERIRSLRITANSVVLVIEHGGAADLADRLASLPGVTLEAHSVVRGKTAAASQSTAHSTARSTLVLDEGGQ